MVWARRFWLRLQTLFRRERAGQRLDDKVQFHLEQQNCIKLDGWPKWGGGSTKPKGESATTPYIIRGPENEKRQEKSWYQYIFSELAA